MFGAELLAPAPIRDPAGHVRALDDTERRIEPLVDIVPITRVYDATPLDRLGVPVWGAVTPLALDLAVHAGKGASSRAARVSAIMEAIERVCAEDVAPERIRTASFQELRSEALDPELFDLPFQTSYAPDEPCSWVRGHDLLTGADVWVALDLVISPAREGLCSGPETNGLAAGNTTVEAVLHGLYEVIERDAAAHERFLRRYGEGEQIPPLRLISVGSLPAEPAAWAQHLQSSGVQLTLQVLTHDIGVPVFRVALSDRDFPGREGRATRFEGLGCDLDPENALMRAICEAAQSHTAVLVGARETFEGAPEPVSAGRFLEWLLARSTIVPFEPRRPAPDDLGERLRIVLGTLRASGFQHCVVVDLTRTDLGVPVVRVLIPGAAGPIGETSRRPALRVLRGLE